MLVHESEVGNLLRASLRRLQATVAMHADADGLCAGCLQRGMFAASPCPVCRQAQALIDTEGPDPHPAAGAG